MLQKKSFIVLIVILLLVGVGIYAYFFTADSQSRQVVEQDPAKAEMLKALIEGHNRPGGPGIKPPGPPQMPRPGPVAEQK